MIEIVTGLRAAYGAVLLVGSEDLLGRLSRAPVDSRAHVVARVLGARELLQAELTRRHPTRSWLRAGAAIDALHAASMIALAATDSSRRTLALQSAAAAAVLALGGAIAAQPPRSGIGGHPTRAVSARPPRPGAPDPARDGP